MSAQTTMNNLSKPIINIGLGAAAAYVGCALFTSINPIAGAVFYAAAKTADQVTKPLFSNLFTPVYEEASWEAKTLAFVGSKAVNLTAGFGLCQAMGYAFSASQGVVAGVAAAAATVSTVAFASLAGFVAVCTVTFGLPCLLIATVLIVTGEKDLLKNL